MKIIRDREGRVRHLTNKITSLSEIHGASDHINVVDMWFTLGWSSIKTICNEEII